MFMLRPLITFNADPIMFHYITKRLKLKYADKSLDITREHTDTTNYIASLIKKSLL